jgi:hypothetical protein
MDRSDADQEGVTLAPKWNMKAIAKEAAQEIILQHLSLCPFAGLNIEIRVRKLENDFARLIGFMIGSGIIGGAAGSTIAHLFMR